MEPSTGPFGLPTLARSGFAERSGELYIPNTSRKASFVLMVTVGSAPPPTLLSEEVIFIVIIMRLLFVLPWFFDDPLLLDERSWDVED